MKNKFKKADSVRRKVEIKIKVDQEEVEDVFYDSIRETLLGSYDRGLIDYSRVLDIVNESLSVVMNDGDKDDKQRNRNLRRMFVLDCLLQLMERMKLIKKDEYQWLTDGGLIQTHLLIDLLDLDYVNVYLYNKNLKKVLQALVSEYDINHDRIPKKMKPEQIIDMLFREDVANKIKSAI